MADVAVARAGTPAETIHDRTAAIQAAIDRCAGSGGGTVHVPAGRYRCGTLFLRDAVTLELDDRATLVASTDRSAYAFQHLPGEGDAETAVRAALIYASGTRGSRVRGGTIDGSDRSFWAHKSRDTGWTGFRHLAGEWRPDLIRFDGCHDVVIEGVTLRRSPVYGLRLAGCTDVVVRDVRVRHDHHGPNTDGFHLSSCRSVEVHDCSFVTGDDCIAIDGNASSSSERITIRDCEFRTLTNAVRLFTGIAPRLAGPPGGVSDVKIENIVVNEAAAVLNITADRGTVERVSLRGVRADLRMPGTPVFIMTSGGRAVDIDIHDVDSVANGVMAVFGEAGPIPSLDRISVTDCSFEVDPIDKRRALLERIGGQQLVPDFDADPDDETLGYALPDPLPTYVAYHWAPYPAFLRHVGHVTFERVTVRWRGGLERGCSALRADDVEQLDLVAVAVQPGGPPEQAPAIELHDVRLARLTGCVALDGTDVFVAVAGDRAGPVSVVGGDLTRASALCAADDELTRDLVEIVP